MKLSLAEKQLILENRAKEESNKPKKQGFLKFDLYDYEREYDCSLDFSRGNYFWLCSKEQTKKWIEEFKKQFTIKLKKGTKFVCFIDEGEEQWYDNVGFGIEDMDANWAKQFLENISKYKE